MVETSILISAVGAVIGAGGLTVALYSVYKQRRMQRQFDRKQELRELAKLLGQIEEDLEILVQYPELNNADRAFALTGLAKESIAWTESYNESVNIEPVFTYYGDDNGDELQNEIPDEIEDPDLVIELIQAGDSPLVSLEIDWSEANGEVVFTTDFPINISRMSHIFKIIEEIKEEHNELLGQFDQDILQDLDENVTAFTTDLLHNIVGEPIVIEPSDGGISEREELIRHKLFSSKNLEKIKRSYQNFMIECRS